MSLLLEALKKAEKAKEEAQRRAREGSEAAEPKLPAPPSAVERKVVTRDKLPDIASAPLEIAADEPPAQGEPFAPQPPPVALELEPDAPAPRPTAKPAARPAAAKTPDPDAAGRASAKKVFEAKFREPNPRMPFYVTVGVLGIFAVGTVIYFWYQLRPPPALVNPTPAPQAQAAQASAQPEPTRVAPAPASVPQAAIPGLPPAPPRSASVVPGSRPTTSLTVEEKPRLTPRLTPTPVRPAAAPPPPAPSAIQAPVVTRTPPQINPRIDAGYNAYVGGDLALARTEYQQALREEPGNRDALLGLAALDVRSGRYEGAEALYLRVLAIDPRDPQAQAALLALRSGRNDPLATESRVKSMLASDPAAHVLNFTLGNQFAQQKRWAEAQQEYFKAYTAEPDNADFAYNLAVSLDHLRQTRQALEYYQRAVTLAEKRGGSFDLAAARSRVAELAK